MKRIYSALCRPSHDVMKMPAAKAFDCLALLI